MAVQMEFAVLDPATLKYIPGAMDAGARTAAYGARAVRAGAAPTFTSHVEALKPAVAELAALETAAQASFIELKLRWRA